jgi:CheY-like chemotaxis protein
MTREWKEWTRVLVAEDDHLTLKLIGARLRNEGLEVLEAANGREALELLHKYRVDLVSTDLLMPAMDGFQLIRAIRQLPGTQGRLPILVVSVNRNEDEMVKCLAVGADDYMTKPISCQLYIEKLWRLYSRSRA